MTNNISLISEPVEGNYETEYKSIIKDFWIKTKHVNHNSQTNF